MKRPPRDSGKGTTESNLKYMRQFYPVSPNGRTLRGELSWAHYRIVALKYKLYSPTEKETQRELHVSEQRLKGENVTKRVN